MRNEWRNSTSAHHPNYTASEFQKDRCFRALKAYFKYKDNFEKDWFFSLLCICYETHQRGFKDTNALFRYYYQLEDGRPLSELLISEEDLEALPSTQTKTLVSKKSSPAGLASTAGMKPCPEHNESAFDNGNRASGLTKQKTGLSIDTNLLCKVCLDATVSVTFVPCGHLVSCLSCSTALVECPVCRAYIRGSVRTYV